MFGLLLFHSQVKKNFRIIESAVREAEKKNEEQELPQYEQEQAFLTHKVRFKGVAVLIFTVSHRRWFNEQDFLDLGSLNRFQYHDTLNNSFLFVYGLS